MTLNYRIAYLFLATKSPSAGLTRQVYYARQKSLDILKVLMSKFKSFQNNCSSIVSIIVGYGIVTYKTTELYYGTSKLGSAELYNTGPSIYLYSNITRESV